MQEILNQVLDILRGLWRFRWTALAVAWGICVLGWLVVLSLPNKYEAKARVFIDPRTALKPVLEGIAIEQDVTAEVNFARQSLLGQAHLQKIVDETGMAAKARTPREAAKVLDDLGKTIIIAVQSGQGSVEGDQPTPSRIYDIAYQDVERERALKVVRILVDTFQQGTLGGKRQSSIDAQKFVEKQIADYETRLGEAEQRLAEFKKRNVGMVPGEQQGDYFTRLQTEMDAVKKFQADLGIAQNRRETLTQQLRGEAPVAASAGVVAGPGGTPAGQGDTLSRIKETQARLDDLKLRYTDEHPDVIATQETLSQLQERRAQELEALKRGDANAAAVTGASSNPVYQDIQLRLNQANVEIAELRATLGIHQQKVAELRRMLDTMPEVEAEYARLNRDYDVTKAQHAELIKRLEKARVGEEAEATESMRFDVLNPPEADYNPVSPQRTLLLGLVLVVGLGGGVGVAYLLSLIKPVIYSAQGLAHLTGATVFGVVSAFTGPDHASRRRRGYLVYSVACSTLFVALVAAVLAGRMFSPLLGGAL